MSQSSPPPFSSKPTFALRSYGCQMNDLDSEYMDGLLQSAGWERIEAFDQADVVIVNTCAVRGGAEERALGRLRSFGKYKERSGPRPVIIVTGCVAQKDGRRMLEELPFLDLVIGTRDWPNLPNLIARAQAGERLAAVDGIDAALERADPVRRVSSVKAYVEAMIGCDNYCSYCIVPYTRGREMSRPAADVVGDLRRLAEAGYKEVTLIGQNVNSYRDGATRFSDLLAMANEVDGLLRLRFVTSNPHDLGTDLIEAMAGLDKVCESLHLPAQAGSDRILARMNRKYTRAQYMERIEALRAAMPTIGLTTDLMVGFPGETASDFQDTVDLMESVRWDGAFTFMYSPREGTAAYAWPDDVAPAVKQRRVAELIERQQRIAGDINAALVGRTQEILVEGRSRRDANELIGRTRGDKPVVFPGSPDRIGRVVTARITESSPHTLRAVIEEAE